MGSSGHGHRRWSPIGEAARKGNTACVRQLIAANVDVKAVNIAGGDMPDGSFQPSGHVTAQIENSPLGWARSIKNDEMVQLLEGAGATE